MAPRKNCCSLWVFAFSALRRKRFGAVCFAEKCSAVAICSLFRIRASDDLDSDALFPLGIICSAMIGVFSQPYELFRLFAYLKSRIDC